MTQNQPLVSIITPSFNQGQYIEETILSIKNQSYNNIEHIVIDGGSSDQTCKILKNYASDISWISEPDNGQTHAINKGIKRSHGDIIAYLNSDDLYLPDTVRIVVDYFNTHPDIEMVYGDIIHIDKQSRHTETVKTGSILLEQYLTGLVYLPQPSVFFRKKIIDEIGYFDERLHLAMDFDYWTRVFFRYHTAYLPVILAKARIYPEAKSSALNKNYLEEKIYILNKFFSDEERVSVFFGSPDTARRIKRRSRGYVFFYGGMEYKDPRELPRAIPYIMKGIWFYPRFLYNPFLLWYILSIIAGPDLAKKIGPHLHKPARLGPL